MKKVSSVLPILFLSITTNAFAGILTYTDRSTFESALNSFTTIDTSNYIGQTTYLIDDDPIYSGAFEFFGPNSLVRNDDLILNGVGFYGNTNPHVGINFSIGINGVGVTTNLNDGGDIMIYDGLNGTGNLLGEADFGDGLVLFGGITSTDLIKSVIFTCEFGSDLKCGLRDPVFGSFASSSGSGSSQVPEPSVIALLGVGLAGLGFARRRKLRQS